jgi:hypothetical protein
VNEEALAHEELLHQKNKIKGGERPTTENNENYIIKILKIDTHCQIL